MDGHRGMFVLLCAWLHLAVIVNGQAITTNIDDSLLLVVGDVTSSTARILFDQVPGSAFKIDVRVHETMARTREALAGATPNQTLEIRVQSYNGRPQVLELRDLEPERRYVVQLEVDDPRETATVMFHTARVKRENEDEGEWTDRVLVVSCDRYVDDHDDVMMEKLARDVEAHDDALRSSSVHFGMAHLGDQIYSDAGNSKIEVVPFPLKSMADRKTRRTRYEAVLEQFRGIYRKTFSRKAAQRVFRIGAHWMLPDDHEIINNFNFELVQKAFYTKEGSELSETDREKLVALQLHCRAGLQAYYEFQYQLYRDFPWHNVDFLEDALGEILRTHPVYFAVELERVKLMFLDVRFERSFFDSSNVDDLPKLVGDDQRSFLDGKLKAWSAEDRSTAVVFSSMPLFFQSAFTALIAYIVEHETYPGMAEQRGGLEDLFGLFVGYNDPRQGASELNMTPLIRLLVGGDLHMMAHSRVCGTKVTNPVCLDQLITSGITNGSTSIQDTKLVPYYYLITQLTPVFEIVYSWAQYIPLLSSLLPSSSPWHIEHDRVFFGRNYGVLEFTADGGFSWNQTVIEPYAEAYQRRVQAFVEASTPMTVGFVALLTVLFNTYLGYRVSQWCCTKRILKRPAKTMKTQ